MRLVCPKCSSQYEVDVSLFPDEGREVQCSNCEEIWFQYPVEDEKPLRLDEPAAVESEPHPGVRPQRPSQRLRDDEQRELAAAVQAEIAARDGEDEAPAERSRGRRKIERRAPAPADDEILSALREQIEKEGGNFEDDAPAKSQKRNLAKAAESAGIAVNDREERGDRRWEATLGTEDDAPSRKSGRWRREKAPKERKRSRKDGLAAALRDLEASQQQRRGLGFRHGFLTAVIITLIGAGVYMFQDDIAQAYPPASPWLAEYDQLVAQGRDLARELYTEFRPVAEDLIDRASAMVNDLTSGGEAAVE